MVDIPRKKIAVHPAREFESRPRLFAALEQAIPIRFEALPIESWRGADAALLISPSPADLEAASRAGVRLYAALQGKAEHARSARVEFADAPTLDRRLRGQLLTDCSVPTERAIESQDSDLIFASSSGIPLWVRRGDNITPVDLVALAPEELNDAESLRDHLRTDVTGKERFIRLLPLIHFLREVTADIAWSPPPLRACFLLDDPNLHRATYGYLNFESLARDASATGYQVAIATIPLDARLARPSIAKVFKENGRHLSLIYHGNDHLWHELEQPQSAEEGLALLAQALRRMESLERRTGLTVERVMSAPHAVASEAACRAMLLLGFEALCVNTPHPWLRTTPPGWPLAGFQPAEFVAGGFPILLRCALSHWRHSQPHREDIVLRAFLDLPLIFAGHHDDLAGGPGALSDAAAQVNSLGNVEWRSLAEIARSSYQTRRTGAVLHVKLFSRRAVLRVPEGVSQIIVELPAMHGGNESTQIRCGASITALHLDGKGTISEPIDVAPGSQIEIALPHPGAVDYRQVTPPAWRPWPIMRRSAAIVRDRLRPILKS